MKKVLVAMSGGVDSSTSAYILKEQGCQIAGLTLNLYSDTCSSLKSADQAKQVCTYLGINHYVLDLQKDFQNLVIKNFINSYLSAQTPNPCILCNEKIKFGLMLEYALNNGYDYLATGHYAQTEKNGNGYNLKIPKDKSKDQTYFLYRLTQKELSKIIFPLGQYTKQEIRDIANKINLPSANNPDSQEICFIKTTYRDFLKKNVKDFEKKVLPGLIVDKNGKKLGRHKGLIYYTIGQRSGLGITTAEPVYVLKLDIATNSVVVGTKKDVFSRTAKICGITFTSSKPDGDFKAKVKIRRMHEPADALISGDIIVFDKEQPSVTPGQSAVFYQNDCVIGGGFII